MQRLSTDPSTVNVLKALDRFPRVPLVSTPTPIRKLAALSGSRREVWLKDDSRTNPVYGGNKPRKLEYLIADAKNAGKQVLTFGFESSNHALATAYHSSRFGVPCHLVLVQSPEGMSNADRDTTRRKMQILRELAASITVVRSLPGAFFGGLFKSVMSLGRLRTIPPGGSSPLGTLGYVRAGFELSAQIHGGELPEPDLIYVPLGTGGTAVGLAIGLAAAGVGSRVIAVKVVPGPVNERPRLRTLAKKVGRLVPELPTTSLTLDNLRIDASQLGEGYSLATEGSQAAVDRWMELESVKIENTYTGKAAASLERGQAKVVLFWQTYSEYRPAESNPNSSGA